MNKKGYLFLLICSVAFVFAIGYFYGYAKDNVPGGETYYLGEKEIALFQTYQDTEEQIFFIEQSARLSALSASKENFQSDFEAKFSQYLDGTVITLQDYTFTYKAENNQMKIIGICSKELEIKEKYYTYSIKPNFKVVVPYSTDSNSELFV